MGKKKKGAALVMTMIIMVSFTLLGTALLTMSLGETKTALYNEKKMQAYYIARSGAEAVAAWLENPSNKEGASIIPRTASDPRYVSDRTNVGTGEGAGSFVVEVYRDLSNPSEIKIESNSTLNADGTKGKAVLTLKESSGGFSGELFEDVIFGDKSMTLNGNIEVRDGDVETNGSLDIKGNVHLTNSNYTRNADGSKKTYPKPVFPSNLNKLVYKSGDAVQNKSYYANISLSNGVLQFDTAGSDMTVMVDKISAKSIKITGGGRVFLFVNQELRVFGNGRSDNSPDDLFIMANAGSSVEVSGNAEFNGYIYGPDAKVKIHGVSKFVGAIIANEVTVSGNSGVTYDSSGADVPSDMLLVGGSYRRVRWDSK